jgi:hypothetical protein
VLHMLVTFFYFIFAGSYLKGAAEYELDLKYRPPSPFKYSYGAFKLPRSKKLPVNPHCARPA